MYLDEQAPQDAFGVSNSNNIFWKLSGGNLLPSLATWGVRVPSLPSEDCVGTDATGLLQAGTCTGGSGGGGTTTIDYDGVDQGTFEVLDFTLTDFAITESPSTDFDIAIHADIARDTELYTDAKVSTYLTTGVGLTEVGGLIDWDTGYAAVLTASSTNWNDFFDTPSSVITAGTDISWTGNTLNVTAHTVDTSAATICSGTGNYLDGEGNCDALVTNTDTQLTNEQVEDFVGAMLGGTETLIAVTYQDGTGDIDFVVDEASLSLTESQISDLTHTTDTNLSEEEVEDFVGGMLGGTETLISVTYVDGTNDIDFVVDEASIDHDALTNFTADEHFLQSAISITESQISDLSHLATSITDGLIIEPDLNTDNAAVDGDILVYDSTGTNFTWMTCAEITGSADLCDGSDATGGGGGGLATSTAIADEYMIYGTAAGTVGGEAAFTYDDATNILTVGSIANHIIGTDIQGILTNEAGLYAALSDVTDFLQSTDALNGELITDNTIDEDSIDWGTGTDQVSLLDLGLAATHDTASELDALYEGELTNEAGLYAALSDVTDFLQASDQNAGTDITADLEEEVTVGSLADGVINEPDLHTDNTAVDGDILVYDSTGTNFIWQTCAEITGSADLCDGSDATGGGGGSGLFASTTGDGGVEVSYLVNTASDLTLGASATSTAPFWFDVSAAVANIGTGGSGDSVIEMAVNSATKWSLGVDDSATNDPFVVSLGSVLGTTNALSINGSTRDTTISTGLVVTDDITLGGDVINEFAGTGLTVSGNALTADLGTDIIATELDADVVATDGDFLQYDSTGTNFTWRSATELVADIEAAMESALDSLLSLVSVAISTTLQIPFGATCDSATDGELCHDNTDDQLILAGAVVGKTTEKIWSTTFASTSAAFIAGGLLPVPVDLDGYTMTAIRCKVDGGTSKTLAVEDASANTTEDIVCAGTVTSDDGSITNAGVTAAEEMYIDFGATSGSVNYVTVSVFGTWTRE